MEAIVFDRPGDTADVLRVATAPTPAPGPGQVRLRVKARVIQPADLLFIRGVYRVKPQYPQVAGFDGVGVVDAVGDGVEPGLVGRRAAFRSPGAWAELALARRARVYPVPDDVDDALACQFPLNPLTAWGLLEKASVMRGGLLLLTAGRSSVARLVTVLAEDRGVGVTRVMRDTNGYCAESGTISRAVRRAPSLVELLHVIRPQNGFHAVLDPVGGPQTLDLIAATAPGARLVSYGVLDDRPFPIQAATLLYRNLDWQGFGIDAFLDALEPDSLARASAALWDLIRRQPDALPVIGRYPLALIHEAVAQAQSARGVGKVLLVTDA